MKQPLVIASLIYIMLAWSSVGMSQAELPFANWQLFDGHGTIMLAMDADSGDIVFANQAAADFYGYSQNELTAMSIFSIQTLPHLAVQDALNAARNLTQNEFLFQHRRADGTTVPVEVESYPLEIEGQTFLYSIIQDVSGPTQLQLRNERLIGRVQAAIFLLLALAIFSLSSWLNMRKLAQKNKQIAIANRLRDSVLDADERWMYLKDRHRRYVFANQAFEDFLGLELKDMVGKTDVALGVDELASCMESSDLKVLTSNFKLEEQFSLGDRIYKASKFPIQLIDGTPGIGAYVQDVTFAEFQRQAQEQTLLRNSILVEVFQREVDSQKEQLDYVLEKALELTKSQYGFVFLYDEDQQSLTLNSWSEGVLAASRLPDLASIYPLEQAGFWGEAIRQRKPMVMNDMAEPNPLLRGFPSGHAPLHRFMSIPVLSDGSIKAVIGLANKDDDYDNNDIYQITLLMTGVWTALERHERELELQTANQQLQAEQNQLQLILDSTAEGIYGIDANGVCVFCNASALRLLGYASTADLIGKKMHPLIHHSKADGSQLSEPDCQLLQSLWQGEGIFADDEVFWRSDGTQLHVSCSAHPALEDGKMVGGVITFLDNGARKAAEEEVRYLSYHDSLTGLYNRMFFEEELQRLNTQRNLPIAIITADMNGLKITNDVFGHDAGDELLVQIARAFKEVCRSDDIIARIGGDEFMILLPQTTLADARVIMERLQDKVIRTKVRAIQGSVSLGVAVKTKTYQQIRDIMKEAEDEMYFRKTVEGRKLDASMLDAILEDLFDRSPWDRQHARHVSGLAQAMGRELGLNESKLHLLEEAAFVHDIGKVAFPDELLGVQDSIPLEDADTMKNHPVVGYRILNSFDASIELAGIVLNHHERWNGSGYPKGLVGEETGQLARIVALADCYDNLVHGLTSIRMTPKAALQALQASKDKEHEAVLIDALVAAVGRDYRPGSRK